MIKAVIIGASGYTGYELVRILSGHKEVKIVAASSRSYEGLALGEVFGSLRGPSASLALVSPEAAAASDADVLFSALPHGASMGIVAEAVKKGQSVIDLSADFRIRDAALYEEWYTEHTAKELIADAVYGLPELHRERIKSARLVANPGCYPTAAILSLAPLFKAGLIKNSVIIDAKSGVSGAGRSASLGSSFVEVADSLKAYKIGCHRHSPEIAQELSWVSGSQVDVTFTPHLVPMIRGILSTAYADLAGLEGCADTASLLKLYSDFYSDEPFVRILKDGSWPDTASVRGSNYCDIGLWADPKTGQVTVVSAIDNLTKGASGQAVQNMNLAFGLDETEGLNAEPLGV